MRKKILLILAVLLICWFAFFNESTVDAVLVDDAETEIKFEKSKWQIKKGWGYEYRNAMLNDLVSDPEIRKLDEEGIVELLGEPSRKNGNYLYYTIDQKRAILFPLHTKSLVVKMNQDTIEWMKIHE